MPIRLLVRRCGQRECIIFPLGVAGEALSDDPYTLDTSGSYGIFKELLALLNTLNHPPVWCFLFPLLSSPWRCETFGGFLNLLS